MAKHYKGRPDDDEEENDDYIIEPTDEGYVPSSYVKSPYTPSIWKGYEGSYGDSSAYKGYEQYDDLPASVSWVTSIGAAIGKKFGVTVTKDSGKDESERWEIDFETKTMRVGSIDKVYSRRGVLGLILNGVSRMAYGMAWPRTKAKAKAFAKSHGVEPTLGKHLTDLATFIDEVRTDNKIVEEYAGGAKVVETMHAQAYEASLIKLKAMAEDMQARRKIAREYLDSLLALGALAKRISVLKKDQPTHGIQDLIGKAIDLVMQKGKQSPSVSNMVNVISGDSETSFGGRFYAAMLIALDPPNTNLYLETMARGYVRNVTSFPSNVGPWPPTTLDSEQQIIRVANAISSDMNEIKTFAGHTGGHAQYVLAKAESYYNAMTLNISTYTPYGAYDAESSYLETQEANDAAYEVAQLVYERGPTKDVGDSIRYAKDLLPIIERFPHLDLNDESKEASGGSSAASSGNGMGTALRRVAGAQRLAPKRTKRERDAKSKGKGKNDAQDRRALNSVDRNKVDRDVQKERQNNRSGYSVLGMSNMRAIDRYAYFLNPYLSRIASTAARISRYLRVNDKFGPRGAYRKGPVLNTRILYRHRLDDYKLFSRKEQEKKESYGFSVMSDLSGSTQNRYSNHSTRITQDEIIAATLLVAEIAERIGEKVRASIGFFSSNAAVFKRPGYPLKRSSLIEEVGNSNANGQTIYDGGTNVAQAGQMIEEDLEDMVALKTVDKNIIFISDGGFSPVYLQVLFDNAKKYKASVAYFQIGSYPETCKQIEKFAKEYAPTVKLRTRHMPEQNMAQLPVELTHLVKEVIGVKNNR